MATKETWKKIANVMKATSAGLVVFSASLPDSTPYSPRAVCIAASVLILTIATAVE